ncbi:MAG: nitronate monooxygenase family protein [Candidatus Absconditabacterales bacterium]
MEGVNIIYNKDINQIILPNLKIGKYNSELPIIQGGMGVGISNGELAGLVAKNGGIGTITSLFYNTKEFKILINETLKKTKKLGKELIKNEDQEYTKLFRQTNLECITKEIKKAKKISEGKGAIFINIMVAVNNYTNQVKTACEAGINGIVSGAGLPLNLPELTKDYPNVVLIPILSTLKGVKILIRKREEKYKKLPDAIILEDPSTAGGHLGAKNLDNVDNEDSKLENSVPQVVEFLKSKKLNIPVIAAGGIVDKKDVLEMLLLGANGVQIGTRFLVSDKNGANQEFKDAIINASENDIMTYMSSAGLPARALKQSKIFTKIDNIEAKTRNCIENCLIHCGYRDGNPNLTQMCLLKELAKETQGAEGGGLMFTGTSATRITKILTVQQIMEIFRIS